MSEPQPAKSAPPRRRRLPPRARWAARLLAAGVVVSLLTLPLTVRWYDVQSLGPAVRHPPSVTPVVTWDVHLEELQRAGGGEVLQQLAPPAYQTTGWLGYDDLGRSLLVRLGPALLISLLIGTAAALLATGVGVLWGAVAALAGGWVDAVLMRIVDVLYSLPYLLTVILLRIALTRPLTALLGGHAEVAQVLILLLAIAGVSWLTMARVIRGQVLSLRGQPFVEAARAAGAGPVRVLRVHLLPNLAGPIIVYATLIVPQAILQESFLSFLGLGVQQPVPSLGRLAADGVQSVNTFVGFWWLLVWPSVVLGGTLLALNFLGDALRDALDPHAAQAR